MRILHIGTGYPPIAGGGLTRYALDLMAAQAGAGHEVTYLCSGDFDLRFRLRIRRWKMGAVQVLELRNPRVENVQLGRQKHPEREITDQPTERLFIAVIDELLEGQASRKKAQEAQENSGGALPSPTETPCASCASLRQDGPPLVVHLHNLMGWPIRILSLLAERGIPVVYTVQNYHAVCPTTRLNDEVTDEVCEDYFDGRRCARCNAAKPPAEQFRFLRRFRLDRAIRAMPTAFRAIRAAKRALGFGHWALGTTRSKHALGARTATGCRGGSVPSTSELSEAFRRRREAFVAALNGTALPVDSAQSSTDCNPKPKAQSPKPGVTVLAMSNRVAELLIRHGVEPSRVKVLPLVLGDFDKIVRRPPRTPSLPIRFGLLNKLTHLKGADVLREAFKGLSPDQVRLLVFGSQSEAGVAAIGPLLDAGVAELRGPYERSRMNEVLSEIDVGLVPSIWEEPYGYVGVEFLAAGIPVLGSRIGGIPDYVEDGVNGFLLPATEPAAWRDKVTELAERPGQLARLAGGMRGVKTIESHLAEIETIYRRFS